MITKEEVIEHFKNAETVMCLVSGCIDILYLETLHEYDDGWWVHINEDCMNIFENGQFAEILTYKNPEFKRGDRVLVRQSNNHEWKERIYLTTIEGAINPFQVVYNPSEANFINGKKFDVVEFKQIKSLEEKPTIDITLEEIAELKGCDVSQIKIKK